MTDDDVADLWRRVGHPTPDALLVSAWTRDLLLWVVDLPWWKRRLPIVSGIVVRRYLRAHPRPPAAVPFWHRVGFDAFVRDAGEAEGDE